MQPYVGLEAVLRCIGPTSLQGCTKSISREHQLGAMQARHEQRLLLLLGKRMIRCQGGTCQAECRGPSPQRTCPLQPQIRSLCCSVWMVASTSGHQASMVVNSTLPGFLLLLAGPRRWRRTSSSPWLGCQHTLGPGCTHEASHTTAKRRQWTSCPGCPRCHSGDCLDSSLRDTMRYQESPGSIS